MIDPLQPDYTNTPVAPSRPQYVYDPKDSGATPVATIITPFYNTGPVFHETARAVFQQSLQQWEWLIVNDGSSDPQALDLLAGYRKCDPRIRVIDHSVNQGLSAARNTGFREARTPYVLQLDSDDLIEPTALEKWVWCLESHPEYGFVKGFSVGFEAEKYLWTRGFHTAAEFLQLNAANATVLIKRAVHQAIGGYDESIRGGLEDWDFWLHCANSGYWGGTVPEYLDWYRRRETHTDRWSNWDQENRRRFQTILKEKYPKLWEHGVTPVELRSQSAYTTLPEQLPFDNQLLKNRPRLLLLLPWMTLGGADKFNLDLVQLLTKIHGYEVTIATTLTGSNTWLPEFARWTPDIFILNHFLRLIDYPRFLRYLIESRQIDTVVVANSYLGYELLPYLRAHCPNVTFMDYLHMEEEQWRDGGYPRLSVRYTDQLDLTVVSSHHLKAWMVERGAEADRIEVCTTNIDCDQWNPADYDRLALRQQFGIAGDEPVILYAARLCAQKQPQVMGEVFLRLARKGARFRGLVAGDGQDRLWLEQFVAEHQLTNVQLLGAVSNTRMRELLAMSDLFFLPSQMEGISLAIYEAMAMGLVPVSADVGGQRELVTPECGVLVPHGTSEIEAYEDALWRLIADEQLRQRMGQAARTHVYTHYSLQHMGRRMVSLLAQGRQSHQEQPRQPVSTGLGIATATLAIERTRLEHIGEQGTVGVGGGTLQAATYYATQYAEMQGWVSELEQAKVWLEEQRSAWEKEAELRGQMFAEQQQWLQEVERSKKWLEEQRNAWQREAERWKHAYNEQQRWVVELERSKKWLEEQTVVQQRWISKLEHDKAWLEHQRKAWKQSAEERTPPPQEGMLEEQRIEVKKHEPQHILWVRRARRSVQRFLPSIRRGGR